MQPINLLPPYIYDKQKKVALIGLWGAVAGIILIACVVYAGTIRAAVSKAQSDKDDAQKQVDRWNAADTKINNIDKEIADQNAKLTFVQNAQKWNDAWPAVYEMMRDWTSDQILLKNMALDAQQHQLLTMTGFATDERKIIQWWMLLRNNPQISSPNFSLPPHGYEPASVQTAGYGGGFGGPPGMMGGMGGGYRGMRPGMGGMSGGPMGGFSGPPGMMGGRGMMGGPMGGPAGMMAGMGGFGGFGANRGGGAGGVTPDEINGRRGLQFTATAMLKQPLAGGIPVPSWPPAAAAGMGGGGMMGGMMGGPAGMMGGPMGGPPGMMGGPAGISGAPMGGPGIGRRGKGEE